jgi:hypothetical protein
MQLCREERRKPNIGKRLKGKIITENIGKRLKRMKIKDVYEGYRLELLGNSKESDKLGAL